MQIRIGCGQVGYPPGMERERILAEIGKAGYAGAPAYPMQGLTAFQVVDLYAQYDLQPAPGYFSRDFWRPEQRQSILSAAQKMGSFTHQVGCQELYVATGGWDGYTGRRGLHRGQVAGNVRREDGLEVAEWEVFVETLGQVCRILLDEGVKPCFHNHAGSVIESGPEIEHLLTELPEDVLYLGPDTGHLAWAGVDASDFCRQYATRIRTIHLKDIEDRVRSQGVDAGWDYDTFCQHGLFTELGEGCVDFPAIFKSLEAAGFDGWAIVETDRPRRRTMLESNTASREYLLSLGY